MKLKFIQGSKTKSQAGFSMLETMVAAMIALIFMSMGANLVLAANIQKIVAKRNVNMNNLAQSDLDSIRSQANYLEKDATGNKCSATRPKVNPSDPDELTVTGSAYGYAAALMKQLGSTDTSTPLESSTPMKVMDRNYTMTRKIEVSTNNHRILKVHYKFIYGGATTTAPDYELYTEVVPNAVYTCLGT